MLLQISKYTSMSLRVDASKFNKKKTSFLLENTTEEKTIIKENVLQRS